MFLIHSESMRKKTREINPNTVAYKIFLLSFLTFLAIFQFPLWEWSKISHDSCIAPKSAAKICIAPWGYTRIKTVAADLGAIHEGAIHEALQ